MPDQTARDRDEFLQRIADRLPFEQAEKIDILRELAIHLSDSIAQLEADGLSPDAAERIAVERLGPPERLADSLTEARRSPRRLLAAAGAGTLAAANGLIYGYLFALAVFTGVSLATFLVIAGLLHEVGGNWNAFLDTTTTTVAALAVAAYVAGRKVTVTVASRAGYPVERARLVTTLLGGGAVLWYALVGWRGTLNWPQVALLLSLPIWFAIGAWRTTHAPFPASRWRLQVLGLAFVAVPTALLLGLGSPGSGSGGNTFRAQGVEKIGLPTPATIQAAIGDSSESGGNAVSGDARLTVAADNPAVLSGWRDFRIEAWRGMRTASDYPGDWVVDPGATQLRGRTAGARNRRPGRSHSPGWIHHD